MAFESHPAGQLVAPRGDDHANGKEYAVPWRPRTGTFAALVALGSLMLAWAAVCAVAGATAALIASDVSDALLWYARSLAELGGALALIGLAREWLFPRLASLRP